MVRYGKKNHNETSELEDMKLNRIQRKYRGHKLAVAVGMSRQDRRHGWGYSKRRAVLND